MKRSYLIGRDISHSISPRILEAAAAAAGIEWRYELLDTEPEALTEAIERVRAADCTGANVTMPYKEPAAAAADAREDAVVRCGATNTLVNRDGALHAHNTDVVAVVASLARRAHSIAAGTAVVLGAGGAAAAAIEGLREVPPREVVVLARRPEQAAALVARCEPWLGVPIRAAGLDRAEAELPTAALLVNATSLGSRADDTLPFAAALISPGLLFYDFVYGRQGISRPQTEALERDALLCDGAVHNLEQAAPSFALLTGGAADPQVVRAALEEALGRAPIDWGAD